MKLNTEKLKFKFMKQLFLFVKYFKFHNSFKSLTNYKAT